MTAPEFLLPPTSRLQAPKIGVILGSGLGGFVETLNGFQITPYSKIDGLPKGSVPGHAGQLHLGSLDGVGVAVAAGRLHTYEGWSAREVAAPVRLLHQLGVKVLLLTNAAGIVNANFKPGRWMLISDHLNLARLSPLTGDAHFLDQTSVYSRELRELLKAETAALGASQLCEGIYAWVNGPEYETPAEVRMLRSLGADAVGMSTVPEAIQAGALGMKVLGLSCLTNYGAGLSGQALSHKEVIEVGQHAAAELVTLFRASLLSMLELANEC